jgi:hypothetical protein
MSDSLSRDTHLSAEELISLSLTSSHHRCLQIWKSFLSTSLLRSQPPTKALRKEPTSKKHTLAWSRWSQWLLAVELFDNEFLESSCPEPGRSCPAPWHSDPLASQDQLILSLLPGQYPIQSTTWRRPLWTPVSTTPITPRLEDPLCTFYSVSTSATKTSAQT